MSSVRGSMKPLDSCEISDISTPNPDSFSTTARRSLAVKVEKFPISSNTLGCCSRGMFSSFLRLPLSPNSFRALVTQRTTYIRSSGLVCGLSRNRI